MNLDELLRHFFNLFPVRTLWRFVSSEGLDLSVGLGKFAGIGIRSGRLFVKNGSESWVYAIDHMGLRGNVGIGIPLPGNISYSSSSFPSGGIGNIYAKRGITMTRDTFSGLCKMLGISLTVNIVPVPGAAIAQAGLTLITFNNSVFSSAATLIEPPFGLIFSMLASASCGGIIWGTSVGLPGYELSLSQSWASSAYIQT